MISYIQGKWFWCSQETQILQIFFYKINLYYVFFFLNKLTFSKLSRRLTECFTTKEFSMLPFLMKACCLINIQLCLFVPFKWYIYITVWAWLVDKHQPGYNRSLPTTYFFTFLLVRFRKMPPSITSVGFLFVKSSLITVTNIANTEWLLRFKLYQRFKTIYHQLDCQLLTPNLNVLN